VYAEDATGATPFQYLVARTFSLDTVSTYLQACRDFGPSTCSTHYSGDEEKPAEYNPLLFRSSKGLLPLDCAAERHSPVSMIRWLIQQAPESVALADPITGRCALHHAVACGAGLGAIHILVEHAPHLLRRGEKSSDMRRSSRAPNGEENKCFQEQQVVTPVLPIHCTSPRTSSAVVDYILRMAPETACIPDHLGRWPLHCAAAQGAHPSVLHRLYQAAPQAIQISDAANGWLPLHCALARMQSSIRGRFIGSAKPISLPCSRQRLLYLIQLYPEATLVSDSDGLLPFYYAGQLSLESIWDLVRAAPSMIPSSFSM